MDISDCLSPEAQNVAEARLAAKRAARAEAREIRMKELERQQKEIYQVQKKYYGLDTKWGDIEQWMEDSERYSNRPRRNPQASDEDEVMSVGSRSSLRTNGYEDELLGISQYKKSSRSSTGSGETSRGPPRDEVLNTYYSDTGSTLNSKSQQPLHNGSRPSLLTCSTLPSRSQRQSSLYDEGVTSGSRRYSSSSSRPPSEYSCYLGSGSRASSRASSARASPVSFEPPSLPVYRCGSTSGISLGCLEDITISSSSGIEERPDKDFTEKGSRSASSLSAATLASLGGSSSRRGSGDTSISVDTEASIREIKEISELKEQIQDVEGKYMQGLKEMKDSLAEVEEKYKRSMVTNAQLDNEKTSLQYQVDNFHEVLLELEEELAESRRQYDEKHKECERQKHEHTVLRFQLAEMKESLEQREQMLAEIRQLQQKLDSSVCEICDLKETIEWKEKKIGALERQKDFFDPVRKERDDLREEVTHLRGQLKKHGIALDSDVTPNGDAASESHGENVYPADEPIMETPLGKTSEVEVKEAAISGLGQDPLTEQGRNMVQETPNKESFLMEGGRASHAHSENDNNIEESTTHTSVSEVCIDNDSEINQPQIMQTEKENEVEHEMVEAKGTMYAQNMLTIGEMATVQRNVSQVDGEVFQDALDFIVPSPNPISDGETTITWSDNDNEDKSSKQESATEEFAKCGTELSSERDLVEENVLHAPEIYTEEPLEENTGANVLNRGNSEMGAPEIEQENSVSNPCCIKGEETIMEISNDCVDAGEKNIVKNVDHVELSEMMLEVDKKSDHLEYESSTDQNIQQSTESELENEDIKLVKVLNDDCVSDVIDGEEHEKTQTSESSKDQNIQQCTESELENYDIKLVKVLNDECGSDVINGEEYEKSQTSESSKDQNMQQCTESELENDDIKLVKVLNDECGSDVIDGEEHVKAQTSADIKESLESNIKKIDQNHVCLEVKQEPPQIKMSEDACIEECKAINVMAKLESSMLDKSETLTEEAVVVELKPAQEDNDDANLAQDDLNKDNNDGQEDKDNSNMENQKTDHILQKGGECEIEKEEGKEISLNEVEISYDDVGKECLNPIDELPTAPGIEHEEEEDQDGNDDKEEKEEEENEDELNKKCQETSMLNKGSSVDRTSSIDDALLDESTDKGTKKGKGKNKEDCVIS
ncbi:leucine-rich repeat flightless-interacting protein 1 isoform X5 [Bombina bombina]|uniref:leucine-rich repeat flightless-interacting protein 1 isoform X5 n=1 Tax=Bombina bombina TaxID=8345 RepID=UPI00235A4F3E|nr:leucine-rich repeat flightless-interacting protein 1 isoform X5 [Bombina bombina]